VDPTTQPGSYHGIKWPGSTLPIRGNFSKPRSSYETNITTTIPRTQNLKTEMKYTKKHWTICDLCHDTILHFKFIDASKVFHKFVALHSLHRREVG